MRNSAALGLALLGVSTIAVSPQRPDTVSAANDFLASLDRTQHRAAVKQVDDDYRTLWRFTPARRQGVSWKGMTSEQEQKATALLRSVLSDVGMKKAGLVRELEQVLAEIERNPRRDHEQYFFTFFGTPSDSRTWAWRYEGHHISLNFAYKGTTLVASTPQFFGSNPAEVKSGPKKGMRALAKEQDQAFAFVNSLSDGQRSKAVVSVRAPRDIFTGENRTAQRQGDEGLRYGDMTGAQQKALMRLVRVHAEAQRGDEVARRLGKIASVGHEGIVFAWMGGIEPGQGHYYRVQGLTFLIEYDNIQNSANHIHAVWRDFDGDFGRDVLAEHYATSAHHAR
ncbi:MAG: DUF3500 domain-containing protein [Armatimonadetes bacterium]|nr:DUF3500 domain-containing protein [Armatimonadota bacterium]